MKGTLPKGMERRTQPEGPEGLILSIIKLAMEDSESANPFIRVDAGNYFANGNYIQHLELLGLPLDWMPEGVQRKKKMDSKYALSTMAKFRAERLLPLLTKVVEDGQVPGDLVEPMAEAIRMSLSVGDSRKYGQAMLSDVTLALLLSQLPEPKPKPKQKSK